VAVCRRPLFVSELENLKKALALGIQARDRFRDQITPEQNAEAFICLHRLAATVRRMGYSAPEVKA
jgi:hypothetical protein